MESMDGKYSAPFEKEEEKIIERINTQEELSQIEAQKKLGGIIKFSDDSQEKKPQDIIMAARDYAERLSGVDDDKAVEILELIKKAEMVFHKQRASEIGPVTKIDTSRKKSFKKNF